MNIEAIVYIASSIDGYIARTDGSLDWLDVSGPEEMDKNVSAFQELLTTVDCLVMGRKTFETVEGFSPWPYGQLPLVILSSTLKTPPVIKDAKIRICSTRPSELLHILAEEGYRRVYIDGGVTIHGFLCEDLIDRITIATIPIVLGTGRPLFPRMDKELSFRLESSVRLASGIVKSTYVRSRNASAVAPA